MVMVMSLAMMAVGFQVVMMVLVSVGERLKVFSGLSLAVNVVRRRALAMTLSRCREQTGNACDSRPGGQTRREKLHARSLLFSLLLTGSERKQQERC